MSTNKSSVLGLNTLNRDSIIRPKDDSMIKTSVSPSKRDTFVGADNLMSGGKVIKCCKLCNIPVPDVCWRR